MWRITGIAALLLINRGQRSLHQEDGGGEICLVSGSGFVLVDSPSVETNNDDERVHFVEVRDNAPAKDGLVDLLGTLALHTQQVGVDVHGDNVAIGEITADQDNEIKSV